MDTRDSSASAHSSVEDTTPHQEHRDCFCCLEGWVLLGSFDHDGQEVSTRYSLPALQVHGKRING
jgi:hypothetical protein